jgi:hypothetical protein
VTAFRRFAWALVLAGSAGCSTSVFDGTVLGYALDVEDGMMERETRSGIPRVTVTLSDVGEQCALAREGRLLKDGSAFVLSLYRQDGGEVKEGKYRVVDPLSPAAGQSALVAQAEFRHNDDSCKSTLKGKGIAQAGTVVLDKISRDSAVGTFDVTFDSGDRVTGSFDVELCEVPEEAKLKALCK